MTTFIPTPTKELVGDIIPTSPMLLVKLIVHTYPPSASASLLATVHVSILFNDNNALSTVAGAELEMSIEPVDSLPKLSTNVPDM